MPIKRLQGRAMMLPPIGKLFKGEPKQKVKKTRPDGSTYEIETFGKELDYWRFESDQRHVAEAFFNAFGAQPRSLPVFLPFMTPEENFQYWQEAYTAGGLDHRCDGEICSVWLDKATGKYRTDPVQCPTLKMTPEQAKKTGCKDVARLQVLIPALPELGFVTMETHSVNDILFFIQSLPAYASLRPKTGLRHIPFILSRFQAEISTPREGKRVMTKKWLVSLRPDPNWSRDFLEAQHQEMLSSGGGQLLLGTSLSPVEEPEEYEESEIVHQAEVMLTEEPRPAPPKADRPPAAQSKLGKQIIALQVPLKLKDDDLIALINKETGNEYQTVVEAVDGISEPEQQDLIAQMRAQLPGAKATKA